MDAEGFDNPGGPQARVADTLSVYLSWCWPAGGGAFGGLGQFEPGIYMRQKRSSY